jgi:hypothetical protein
LREKKRKVEGEPTTASRNLGTYVPAVSKNNVLNVEELFEVDIVSPERYIGGRIQIYWQPPFIYLRICDLPHYSTYSKMKSIINLYDFSLQIRAIPCWVILSLIF